MKFIDQLSNYKLLRKDPSQGYQLFSYLKLKLSLCFNWAPRHKGVLGEWSHTSTHSWPRH